MCAVGACMHHIVTVHYKLRRSSKKRVGDSRNSLEFLITKKRKMIEVVDNALPEETFTQLQAHIDQSHFTYGWKAHQKTDPHGHWNVDFGVTDRNNIADIETLIQPTKVLNDVWHHIRNHVERKIGPCVLIRAYCNAHTYGTDGYCHTDSDRDNEVTAVIYLNDTWSTDWAGETVIFGDDRDIMRAILPRRNRMLFFAANLLHCARGVSRICNVLRRTMVFKTRLTRSPSFERVSRFLFSLDACKIPHSTSSNLPASLLFLAHPHPTLQAGPNKTTLLSAATLHVHLTNVFRVLEITQHAPALCLAGALHSVFGTTIFRTQLVELPTNPSSSTLGGALTKLISISGANHLLARTNSNSTDNDTGRNANSSFPPTLSLSDFQRLCLPYHAQLQPEFSIEQVEQALRLVWWFRRLHRPATFEQALARHLGTPAPAASTGTVTAGASTVTTTTEEFVTRGGQRMAFPVTRSVSINTVAPPAVPIDTAAAAMSPGSTASTEVNSVTPHTGTGTGTGAASPAAAAVSTQELPDRVTVSIHPAMLPDDDEDSASASAELGRAEFEQLCALEMANLLDQTSAQELQRRFPALSQWWQRRVDTLPRP